MYHKKFIVSLFAIALFLTGNVVFAQTTAPIRGKVELVKADGTKTPVADAEVTAYRTDISKGKLPSSKSDKKGFFSFAGVPYGQTFVLVVTAPNIRAGFYPNVKANMENILVQVDEGDGTIPTEEQIREALVNTTPTGELSAEEKKRQADLAKKNAEITARNERIKNSIEVTNRALSEGNKAKEAGDFDTAVIKYEEGYNADPTFVGTAPVFLINKADVLKRRGFKNYQKIAADPTIRATLIEAVKNDLLESANASQKSLNLIKGESPTDAALQKRYEAYKIDALSIMTDAYRLLIETRADEAKNKEAVESLEAYLLIEPNIETKKTAQMKMADAFRKIGKSDDAIPLYRKALETSPDDANAMAGLGLSLFNSGAIAKATGDTEKNEALKQQGVKQMQEGLDVMQRFTDIAPDTHALKASVKDIIEFLKTQEKLTPQKMTKPTTTKKRT